MSSSFLMFGQQNLNRSQTQGKTQNLRKKTEQEIVCEQNWVKNCFKMGQHIIKGQNDT